MRGNLPKLLAHDSAAVREALAACSMPAVSVAQGVASIRELKTKLAAKPALVELAVFLAYRALPLPIDAQLLNLALSK